MDRFDCVQITVEKRQAQNLVLLADRGFSKTTIIHWASNPIRLRDELTRQQTNEELSLEAQAARAEVINVVNNFF